MNYGIDDVLRIDRYTAFCRGAIDTGTITSFCTIGLELLLSTKDFAVP